MPRTIFGTSPLSTGRLVSSNKRKIMVIVALTLVLALNVALAEHEAPSAVGSMRNHRLQSRMLSSWPFLEPMYLSHQGHFADPFALMEQDLSAAAARAFNALHAFNHLYDDAQAADALQDADARFHQALAGEHPSAEPASGEEQQQQKQQQQQQQQLLAPFKPTSVLDWINRSAGALSVIPRDKSYDISIDVPGVPKEQLKVQIKDHPSGRKLLHVSGERKQETATSFTMNKVSRSVLLPSDIDASANLSANYEHGVLKLSVPKNDKPQSSGMHIPIV